MITKAMEYTANKYPTLFWFIFILGSITLIFLIVFFLFGGSIAIHINWDSWSKLINR